MILTPARVTVANSLEETPELCHLWSPTIARTLQSGTRVADKMNPSVCSDGMRLSIRLLLQRLALPVQLRVCLDNKDGREDGLERGLERTLSDTGNSNHPSSFDVNN